MGLSMTEHEVDPHRPVRLFAAAAAALTAILYGLVGVGVLDVGDASSGAATDLFAFGAVMAAVFLVTAVLLFLFRSRVLWAAVAVLQVIVIVGYFAMANLRVPGVELNGVLIKVCQAGVLAAVGWLLLRDHPLGAAASLRGSPSGRSGQLR